MPPPRYKMAIVTWIAIFPLITAMSYALQTVAENLPAVASAFISSLVLVPLMTYLVMPRMTRLCERWLYPHRSGSAKAGNG